MYPRSDRETDELDRLVTTGSLFQDRIQQAEAALDQAGKLVRQLQQDLRNRADQLAKAKAEAKYHEARKPYEDPQEDIRVATIPGKFEDQAKTSTRQWLWGLVLAFVISLIVNWISSPALHWITAVLP
ncbi:hypothetical protein QRX60_43065 [Amycolatopsis mongoliensis]|uniref:Uncharacterized protein n=1 Tax=Amycolatopsis mongoliensis TaxID=715475 RepID=A0A9Y2NIH9_9PSEU|nr:hypothetical protein [Amycolatopsis sp. 4-36]WIY00768.1 hypothetical protein QRX60_43065 [Amycolatopsis sp. 4-36]